MNNFGTEIFWTSLTALIVILSLSAVIGRWVCGVLPRSLHVQAKFYLSPILGLAILLLLATALGWALPLGNSVLVPVLVVTLLVVAMTHQSSSSSTLKYVLAISLFGIGCAASLLVPLYVFGGFDAHNDTSTYLAHSQWLQDHAFRDKLSLKVTTPYSGQVLLYQTMHLRMGGSFILAMLQAILNAPFAYEIYPAVVVSAVVACCLAAGLPLARILRKLPRIPRMMLLSLPAFTVGGLEAGVASGFLPQTFGLALGGATLFLAGPTLAYASRTHGMAYRVRLAFPIVLLFVAAVFTYSEIAPFLALALASSWFFAVLRNRKWPQLLGFAVAFTSMSALFLNAELLRAYDAIRLQSGVVVGNAVDWPEFGFLIHAIGLYAGDTQQPFPGYARIAALLGPHVLVSLVAALTFTLILVGYRLITSREARQMILPAAIMLGILGVAFAYFRYMVVSPFPRGYGQSWDQFKISEWSHPFVMVLALAVAGTILGKHPKSSTQVLKAVYLAGLVFSGWFGFDTVRPLSDYYKTHNIYELYGQLRSAAVDNCAGRVYVALPQYYQAFRRIAAVFLYDRNVTSDWTGDVYIQNWISPKIRAEQPHAGDCVLEENSFKQWTNHGQRLDAFWLGSGTLSEKSAVTSVSGAYNRESDNKNWWYWVNQSIEFKFDPKLIVDKSKRARVRFEYASVSGQRLTLKVLGADGRRIDVALPIHGMPVASYDGVIDLPAAQVTSLTIESADPAIRLGVSDPRLASFIVRNLVVGAELQL